jgi:hypothetical protein
VFVLNLAACGSFGLELAELGHGAADDVVGLGSGAVNGALLFFENLVFHGVDQGLVDEVAFGKAVAAQAPCGGDDFAGEDEFERSVRDEFGEELLDHLFVGGFFAGADVCVARVETFFAAFWLPSVIW